MDVARNPHFSCVVLLIVSHCCYFRFAGSVTFLSDTHNVFSMSQFRACCIVIGLHCGLCDTPTMLHCLHHSADSSHCCSLCHTADHVASPLKSHCSLQIARCNLQAQKETAAHVTVLNLTDYCLRHSAHCKLQIAMCNVQLQKITSC